MARCRKLAFLHIKRCFAASEIGHRPTETKRRTMTETGGGQRTDRKQTKRSRSVQTHRLVHARADKKLDETMPNKIKHNQTRSNKERRRQMEQQRLKEVRACKRSRPLSLIGVADKTADYKQRVPRLRKEKTRPDSEGIATW